MDELRPLMLLSPPWTVAVAESLTGGHVQAGLTAISGASDFFLGGITAYSLAQKTKLLGVEAAAAEPVNSVSQEVAEQMARGVCTLFGSDWGVGTTGYAEPAPSFDVREPFAWWAVYFRGNDALPPLSLAGRMVVAGRSRVEVQQRIAREVVHQLAAAVTRARASYASASPRA